MPRDKELPSAGRVTEDRFAAVVRAFLMSPKFRGYARATQDLWGRYLLTAADPAVLGAVLVHEIRPKLVQAFIDGFEDQPYSQKAALAAIKQLDAWAGVRDMLPRQIAYGVTTEDTDEGHIPWTDEQVALAEQHASPAMARAITLGANTGQRGSDLIRLGPTDIEIFDGLTGLNVTQKKTGRRVWVPVLTALAAAIATWERRPGPYLMRPDGRPWTRPALSAAWGDERDRNPALAPLRACGPANDKPLVLHGLRGHACVRLLRAGANTRQVSDMVGMSEGMVARYTRFSQQQENAAAAVYNIERTIRERNTDKSKSERS